LPAALKELGFHLFHCHCLKEGAAFPSRPGNRQALRFVREVVRETPLSSEERFVMQVRHILQEKGREVIVISQTATVGEAARLLAARRIGAVIVKGGVGAFSGILSERDLVRAIAAEGAQALDRNVASYMTRSVATCEETDTVEDLMEMMTRGRFRHVPVLDDKQSLCGLISIGDVVKTRIAETVSEANSLREYISATA
jgi:CBS domain-containing protein